jgi:hypothetical protein
MISILFQLVNFAQVALAGGGEAAGMFLGM